MPVEQGLPWHPVATGLAGQAIPPPPPHTHKHTLGTVEFQVKRLKENSSGTAELS